jgi:hypothetical protein
MDAIYALKPLPNSIKRLIYVYMLGLGTESSKLIKEEHGKLDRRKKLCMRRKGDIWDSDKIIGFIGCKACIKLYFTRTKIEGTYKCYKSGINAEEWLYSEQVYEVDHAKLFYLYHYSSESLFQIMLNVRTCNIGQKKLMKHKLLQLQQEEELNE